MQTSDKGIALIKQFEGCKLTAYQDSVGVWTIGYGWTQPVDGKPIRAGMTIKPVSYTHLRAHETVLSTSTLLRKLNAGDYAGAADEFLRWNKAGGKVLNGLTRRREAERALFLS